jgi:hypothetical protein
MMRCVLAFAAILALIAPNVDDASLVNAAGTHGRAWDSSGGPVSNRTSRKLRLFRSDRDRNTGAGGGVAGPVGGRIQAGVRTVKVAGGMVKVERERADEGERDRVTVTGETGALESDSRCPLEFGSYDQFSAFFTRLVRAVVREDTRTVASLARYPLRVNGVEAIDVTNAAELERRYDEIFTPKVIARIRAAVPAKIFCRHDSAMIGHGVVWASAERGRVAFDVINH